MKNLGAIAIRSRTDETFTMTSRSSNPGCFDRVRRYACVAAAGVLLSIGGCVTSSTVKPARQPCEVDAYASSHPHPVPSGVPSDWDNSIPMPAQARVTEVSDPEGVIRRVDFQTAGETYSELKTFYTTELGAAGYKVENPVERAEQKTIDITFSACGRLDTVSIFPDPESPKDLNIRIVYDTNTSPAKDDTSNSALSLSTSCSFGDADACNQLNSRPGGADAAAAHDAAIQEELKSPEQRAKDRDRALYGP